MEKYALGLHEASEGKIKRLDFVAGSVTMRKGRDTIQTSPDFDPEAHRQEMYVRTITQYKPDLKALMADWEKPEAQLPSWAFKVPGEVKFSYQKAGE
jgi:hypothetical protein